LSEEAVIDRECMPSDKARLIRAEEHDRGNDFLGLTHASDRERGHDLLRLVAVSAIH
jgi:hypothetical protein